jgi:hypothetical protein
MTHDAPNIGLGVLSWQGHDSLSRTLPTYRAERLYDLVGERVMMLPEAQSRTVALGQAHGFRVLTAPHNLGILGGFKALATAMKSDILLLLEDDLPLIEPHAEVARQLAMARTALAAGEVEVFRLRHRAYPGMGARFGIIDKLHRYLPPDDAPVTRKLAARLRRTLRAEKAERLASNLLYENGDPFGDPYTLNAQRGDGPPPPPMSRHRRMAGPEAVVPGLIEATGQGWYRVSARAMPWSNQSIMIRRDFFLERILAHAEAHPRRRRVNGFPDIEKELNGRYWRRSGWHVGVGPGLFSHEVEC